MEEEKAEEKISFPKSVYIVYLAAFMFSVADGILQSVEGLYLENHLLMKPATIHFHRQVTSNLASWLSPIGALLADAYVGYFFQFFVALIIYRIFGILAPISTLTSIFPKTTSRTLMLTGFYLGSLVDFFSISCATAFVGDQFVLPQQIDQLSTYFHVTFWLANVALCIGNLITSKLITGCVDPPHCYTFSYWIIYTLQLLGTMLIVVFRRWFQDKRPRVKRLVCKVSNVFYISTKRKLKDEGENKECFLDYCDDVYSKNFIEDMKRFKILLMLLPLPIFWALFSETHTVWKIQLAKMDKWLGKTEFSLNSLQGVFAGVCSVVVPLLLLVIYPSLLKRNKFRNRFHRMGVGAGFYIIAFMVGGIVSLKIDENATPKVEEGHCHIRVYNNLNCDISMSFKFPGEETRNISVAKMDHFSYIDAQIENNTIIPIEYSCGGVESAAQVTGIENERIGVYFRSNKDLVEYTRDLEKDPFGQPVVRVLFNSPSIQVVGFVSEGEPIFIANSTMFHPVQFPEGVFTLYVMDVNVTVVELRTGGVYYILVNFLGPGSYDVAVYEMVKHSTVHVSWMFLSYILVGVGEVLFKPAQTEFFYTHAPVLFKATVATHVQVVGALTDIVTVMMQVIYMKTLELSIHFFCAGTLIAVDLLIFIWLAKVYKYDVLMAANVLEGLEEI